MWKKPWSLKEGFTIGAGLIVAGLLLQFTAGSIVWEVMTFPVNVVFLAIFLVSCALVYGLRNQVYGFRFLSSYASAVPCLVYTVALTIVMGLTRQLPAEMPVTDPMGLSHMLSFWPFVLIYLWMAIILSQVALHSIFHFRMCKWPTAAFHIGLLIVLLCATLGSADMQRLKMTISKDAPEWRGIDNSGKIHELPIAIQLLDFKIEEYAPRLLLVDNDSGAVVKTENLMGWQVRKLKVINEAAPMMAKDTTYYVNWRNEGNVKAWLIRATSPDGKLVRQGWITCGSYRFPMQLLKLNKNYSIAMAEPEPSRYLSKVQILTKTGKNIITDIEVNHPFDVDGWKIYQYSYDEKMGRWSAISVLELVADPWLPYVYIGIFLLALGAVGMFLTSKGNKKTQPQTEK